MPRVLAAVLGTFLGAVVGSTVGGLVGRGIALLGDETVEIAVPMAFCAVVGYALGGAMGAKATLDGRGSTRTGAAASVAGFVLFLSIGLGAALGSDTVAIFLGVLVGGLVLAGAVAASIAGAPGSVEATTPAPAARPVEVRRSTVAASKTDPPGEGATAPRPRRREPLRAQRSEGASPAARPRRTRPLRAGDADGSDE